MANVEGSMPGLAPNRDFIIRSSAMHLPGQPSARRLHKTGVLRLSGTRFVINGRIMRTGWAISILGFHSLILGLIGAALIGVDPRFPVGSDIWIAKFFGHVMMIGGGVMVVSGVAFQGMFWTPVQFAGDPRTCLACYDASCHVACFQSAQKLWMSVTPAADSAAGRTRLLEHMKACYGDRLEVAQ